MEAIRLKQIPAGFILTPGASADRNHESLVVIHKGIDEVPVKRITLGTTSVPTAVKKICTAGEALASELDVAPEQIAYGGRSFGGRACSVAIAEGLPACALVLLSYPLHPPGKPHNLRVDHFDRIDVPTLFISGDKDPFGSPKEFAKHVSKLKGPYDMRWIKGNHSPKGQEPKIIDSIRWFFTLPMQ